ncbi:hypothetical protein [Pseudoramibacter sp.]|jgi:hypothetical protein|uniref:hypothetical protein n=1 Tax=Pseudoramibacter sp. TaxID=2034862 RepID=UPI0025D8B0FB|nr:hypothetical protein [Pseudoramibacter sp.]MCH4072665.1 hypothetical protein [Pseudoramibacter sp.]MCH4106436.1 hypothetical protein [Pseudoramibacter sp.]
MNTLKEKRGEALIRMNDHLEVTGFRSTIAYQLLPGDPLIPLDSAVRQMILMNDDLIENNIKQIKVLV